MAMREPQSAGDYDDRTTGAVKSVLIEIGQVLGYSFTGSARAEISLKGQGSWTHDRSWFD